jgi:hypothetical protein
MTMPAQWRDGFWADLNEEDKWVANPVTGALLRPNSGGKTTGTASAKAAPANIAARSTHGRLAATVDGTDETKLPVAVGDLRTAWDSLAIVAGTVLGGVIAVVGWWGAWKVIERTWENRGSRRR